MTLRLLTLGTLGLAALVPGAALADPGREDAPRRPVSYEGDRGENRDADRRDADRRDADRDHDRDGMPDRVWIGGHFEQREQRNVIPAVVRQEWVPERCEMVRIPAVTERVCVPAVTERVYCPAVTERVVVPEVRDRVLVPGHYENRTDARGCAYRVWISTHYETRVVREAQCEDRVVRAACWETRVVRPECWETRIVVPERCERRVVEAGHWQTVVVCPERCEVSVEKVWVPGHWESRGRWPRT